MIELKNINKFYGARGSSVSALAHVSLSISQGDIFGIIGRSGAGKSTLLRTINLLERPDSGEVLIDGCDLTKLSGAALRQQRRKIGMVFQHFNLLSSRNVFENIALPLELEGVRGEALSRRVDELLELVELKEKRFNYPAELSGGQKQRVAIARALACAPKILLSDEATSALDPETTKNILSMLRRIGKELKVTIVLITHQMDVVKQICNRVALIEGGKIVEEAEMVRFFASPQSATAKKLVASCAHIDLPEYFLKQLQSTPSSGSSPILKLVFYKQASGQPMISFVSIKFQIHINILQAHLDSVRDEPMGIMVCQLLGEQQNIDAALHYFTQSQILSEVIGYVPNDSSALHLL